MFSVAEIFFIQCSYYALVLSEIIDATHTILVVVISHLRQDLGIRSGVTYIKF